jgi:Zn-dependent peptidase ImmA (M78 family)/transcriptional regulator with XRE-family HTH domain
MRWARESLGVEIDELAAAAGVSPDHVRGWEAGDVRPTYRQLTLAGARVLRDPAFFVAEAMPREEPVLGSFRRLFGSPEARPSSSLLRQLAIARSRRAELLDLYELAEQAVPRFDLDVSRERSSVVAARELRAYFGVSFQDQGATRSPYALLRLWTDSLERRGVLVFHASRVPLDDFRGLAVRENPLPFVLLNGADGPESRIFTLLHEVGHLACGQDDWSQGPIESRVELGNDGSTERFCNELAADLLMPADSLRECCSDLGEVTLERVERLARTFKVSRFAMGVRLRRLALIDAETLSVIARSSTPVGRRDGGGDYYRTQVRNLGRHFTSVVLSAMYGGLISARTAGALLGTRRAEGVEKMRAALGASAS